MIELGQYGDHTCDRSQALESMLCALCMCNAYATSLRYFSRDSARRSMRRSKTAQSRRLDFSPAGAPMSEVEKFRMENLGENLERLDDPRSGPIEVLIALAHKEFS